MSNSEATSSRVVYRRNSPVGQLPILVGILAILIALFGVFFLVIGLLLLATGIGLLVVPAASAFAPVAGGWLFAGLVSLVFGAVLTAVATGLWDLETWALWLTGAVVSVVIVALVVSGSFGWSLLIAAALLVYLVAVRNHFY